MDREAFTFARAIAPNRQPPIVVSGKCARRGSNDDTLFVVAGSETECALDILLLYVHVCRGG